MEYGFEKFNFKDLNALREKLNVMGLDLPVSKDVSVLAQPVGLGARTLKNALCVHPMEGCDSMDDGSPSEMVYRRYERFAQGGSALLWVEACAVCSEGRANPRQLSIHEGNKDKFKTLVSFIREKAAGKIYLVLQLTHSGRYSKPYAGAPAIIACENRYLDPFLPPEVHSITDEELGCLEDKFADAARFADYAGFDAVDIKCCHRYLSNELLSAYRRPGSYGGTFKNRTRFLFNIVEKVLKTTSIDVAVRLNAYDEIPYPYGFGVNRSQYRKPDLTEIKLIVRRLYELGVRLVNITSGNPYYNPHVNRPYDTGTYTPPDHPLENVYKLLDASRQVKRAVPDMTVIAAGLTWLRDLGANVAAGCIGEKWFDLAGFGRQAFAYPDFANDILAKGELMRSKCCITCSKCTTIMRDGGAAGCVIRDPKVYLPIYQVGRQDKQDIDGSRIAEHI